MPSWGDGEESSDDSSSLGTEGPNTMYDSDFCGLADERDGPVYCKCCNAAEKFVSFEGWSTGRRFYACSGQEGATYDFLQWLDGRWPSSMEKSLDKLWEMYSEAKQGRVNDALNSMERRFEYQDQITKLHLDLRNAQDELKQVVEEKQVTLALKAKAEHALIEARAELDEKKKLEASTCNLHKCLKLKAEKERDKMKEEKRKLEFIIADLLKQKEGTRAKLRKIKEICDEFVP